MGPDPQDPLDPPLLRIDTGGRAPFNNSAYIYETIKGILVNHTSNERAYFSQSYDQ